MNQVIVGIIFIITSVIIMVILLLRFLSSAAAAVPPPPPPAVGSKEGDYPHNGFIIIFKTCSRFPNG